MNGSSIGHSAESHRRRTRVDSRHLLVLYVLSAGSLVFGGWLTFRASDVDANSSLMLVPSLLLLTAMVLLPLRSEVQGGEARFSVLVPVLVNLLYFVVGPAISLLASNKSATWTAWPTPLLILSLGFFLFYVGVSIAPRTGPTPSRRSCIRENRAFAPAFILSLVSVWFLRLWLLARGLGITHGPTLADYSRGLGMWAVTVWNLSYVPVCICLAGNCGSTRTPRIKSRWAGVLPWVVASDCLYYILIGWRLFLLWELLLLLWVRRSRPAFVPPRPLIIALAAVVLSVPLVYAERATLGEFNLESGESQLEFLARRMAPATGAMGAERMFGATEQGLEEDAGHRWNAIDWFSEVAYQHSAKGYPLLLGSSWMLRLPSLVPRALWPGKPVQRSLDVIVDRHFDLPLKDDLKTTETEVLANFGAPGFWAWMILYGMLAGFVARSLATESLRESTLFLILCALPVLFLGETDVIAMLAGLRAPLAVWVLLRVFERPDGMRVPRSSPVRAEARLYK